METNQWEIIDDNGVIYSGTESEMVDLFFRMQDGTVSMPKDRRGDLKLIEVHGIYK